MAQQMYEEKKIRAIATKIRSLAPILGESKFTTAEIPDAIERVYEDGKRKGQTEGYGRGYGSGYTKGLSEGYEKGYSEGTENNQGVELPTLSNPGTSNDLIKGKQLIDGDGNIVEGAIVQAQGGIRRTVNPQYVSMAGVQSVSMVAEVSVPTCISPATGPLVVLTTNAENFGDAAADKVLEGSTFTSKNGIKVEGAIPIKTSGDIYAIAADKVVNIPSGYYQEDMAVDCEPIYDNGFDDGNDYGYNKGYAEGAASVSTYEDGNGVKY